MVNVIKLYHSVSLSWILELCSEISPGIITVQDVNVTMQQISKQISEQQKAK